MGDRSPWRYGIQQRPEAGKRVREVLEALARAFRQVVVKPGPRAFSLNHSLFENATVD